MPHDHIIIDDDARFIIDTESREITKASGNSPVIMQGDHNSERFTFEMPRTIEGHEVLDCDKIEIEYVNTQSGTSVSRRAVSADKYVVDDVVVDPNDDNRVIFSWLLGRNATMYAGALAFQIKIECYDDSLSETSSFVWRTDKYSKVSIRASLGVNEMIIDSYPEALEKIEYGVEAVNRRIGDHEHAYLTLDEEQLILVGDDLHPNSRTLTVRFTSDNVHFVTVDTSEFELEMNSLAGRWVVIGDQTIYIGFNTVDTLALYTDDTMKTPAIMTIQEGTVIYPYDSNATNSVRKLINNEAVSVDLSAMDTTGEIIEVYADDTVKTTTMEFDENGNPTKITDSDGHVTTLTW